MKSLPEISDSEWDIMKIVWDHGPLTSGDVVKHLSDRHWKPRTVKTLLSRLVSKGAVGTSEEPGRFLYAAKIPRETLVRQESKSFLVRVFDGAIAPALVHFIADADLSPKEVAELKKILDRGGKS